MRAVTAAIIAVLALGGTALAECASDEAVAALAGSIAAGTPATLDQRPATMEEALCTQGKLVALLGEELGEPVGYKVGLTSKPAQERFGASEPVRGVMPRSMLRKDKATIPAAFGARPIVEADLLVTVRSDGINGASTPAEVLPHLADVRPFIELADLVLAEGERLDPLTITAINVGARSGVAGRPVPVEATPEFEAALAGMTVRVTVDKGDGAGPIEVMGVPGAAILGHPLEALLWLMNDGVKLEAGDVVSLGSFGAPMPAMAGETVRVVYDGLPGKPDVSVTFE